MLIRLITDVNLDLLVKVRSDGFLTADYGVPHPFIDDKYLGGDTL